MPYELHSALPEAASVLTNAGIEVTGEFSDLLDKCRHHARLDIGRCRGQEQRALPEPGLKAVFQGGEAGEIADVFFHGYANYDDGIYVDYLKLTSCNTPGSSRPWTAWIARSAWEGWRSRLFGALPVPGTHTAVSSMSST